MVTAAFALLRKAIFVSWTSRIMLKDWTPLSTWRWTRTRVNTSAANIEVMIPTLKVVAKPRIGPVPT